MKYIKLYEDLNSYYYPITYDESITLQSNIIDINLSINQLFEIEKIFKHSVTKRNLDIIYFDKETNSTNSKEIPFIYINQDQDTNAIHRNIFNRINIVRLDDEWFIVDWPKKNLLGGESQRFYTPPYGLTYYKYYAKCDQFEGVLELLRLYQNFTD